MKRGYADSLKNLEQISNEIHMKRKNLPDEEILKRPREPGVGAELTDNDKLPDFNLELEKCEVRSLGSFSETTSSVLSEHDDIEYNHGNLMKDNDFTHRPIDGGEGSSVTTWINEMDKTLDNFDHISLDNCTDKNEVNYINKLKEVN